MANDNGQVTPGLKEMIDEILELPPIGLETMRRLNKVTPFATNTDALEEMIRVPKTLTEEDLKNIKTMRDVRAKHYEIFSGADTKLRGEKEGVLKYIDALGAQTHTDVSDWPVSKFMFKGKIILSRPKINKIFFELKEKQAIEPKTVKYTKASELNKLSSMLGSGKAAIQSEISGYKNAIGSTNAEVEDLKRNAAQAQRRIKEYQAKVDEFEEELKNFKEQSFSKDLRKLLKTGNFMVTKDQPNRGIYLMTRPIKKTFFDKKQATNLFVNFGQFKLWARPERKGWSVRVYEGKDNITTRGYLHPHVQGRGQGGDGTSICLGEAANALNEANRKSDFYGAMMAIWSVLADFEDRSGDGYIALHEFEATQKQLIAKGAINGTK